MKFRDFIKSLARFMYNVFCLVILKDARKVKFPSSKDWIATNITYDDYLNRLLRVHKWTRVEIASRWLSNSYYVFHPHFCHFDPVTLKMKKVTGLVIAIDYWVCRKDDDGSSYDGYMTTIVQPTFLSRSRSATPETNHESQLYRNFVFLRDQKELAAV